MVLEEQWLWFSLSGKLTVLNMLAPSGLPAHLVGGWLTACGFVRCFFSSTSCSLLEEVTFDEGIGSLGVQFHHLHVARVDILLELLGVLMDEVSRVGVPHVRIFFLLELSLQVFVC